jgi:pimeloyl-ACP methyl ester carboxylesterase
VRLWLEDGIYDKTVITEAFVDEGRERKLHNAYGIARWYDALEAGRNGATEEEVRGITAPTLIIWGKQDARDAGRAERQHQDIKGSPLVWLDNSGHYPQYGPVAELSRLIADFLRQ